MIDTELFTYNHYFILLIVVILFMICIGVPIKIICLSIIGLYATILLDKQKSKSIDYSYNHNHNNNLEEEDTMNVDEIETPSVELPDVDMNIDIPILPLEDSDLHTNVNIIGVDPRNSLGYKFWNTDKEENSYNPLIHKDMGCLADTQIYNREKYRQFQQRINLNNSRTRNDMKNYKHLYEEEWKENEQQYWYERDDTNDYLGDKQYMYQ